MKKTTILIGLQVIFLVAFALQMAGCKKDDDGTPSNAVLVSGTWQLEELLVNGDVYTGDISNYSLTLVSDNTYSLTDVDGTQINGSWELTNDDTILMLDANEYIIVSLTAQNAELTGSERSEKTGSRELTYKLIKV